MSQVTFPIRIAGTGHALPARVVTSAEMDERLGLVPGTLETVSGVAQRHVCEDEDQIMLAARAAEDAIADAGIDRDEIDLVLGACGIPYQTLPATAPIVMERLGLGDGQAAAFDVNATCLGFLAALDLAAGKIAAGQARCVLVFSADIASRALPWDDQPNVAALFGDGAAAAIVTGVEGPGGLRATLMRSYPSAHAACQIGAGGTRFDFWREAEDFARHTLFRMDGKELFRVTHRHFPAFVDALLEAAGWSLDEVDLVVPHQASPLALDHMVKRTGLAPSRVVNVARGMGNQIAASIPTALDLARKAGRAGQGTRLLMLGTSAGVTFGGAALEVA